jgi:hypothetical protein
MIIVCVNRDIFLLGEQVTNHIFQSEHNKNKINFCSNGSTYDTILQTEFEAKEVIDFVKSELIEGKKIITISFEKEIKKESK